MSLLDAQLSSSIQQLSSSVGFWGLRGLAMLLLAGGVLEWPTLVAVVAVHLMLVAVATM
jgi:hypothetical protein